MTDSLAKLEARNVAARRLRIWTTQNPSLPYQVTYTWLLTFNMNIQSVSRDSQVSIIVEGKNFESEGEEHKKNNKS